MAGWLAGKRYKRVRDADVLGWLAVFVWVVLDDFMFHIFMVILSAAEFCQKCNSYDSDNFVVF